jgi:hypothetical protein
LLRGIVWVAPLMVKITLPVGVPAPGATGATVALKVTVWVSVGLLGAGETVVVVDAWLTV